MDAVWKLIENLPVELPLNLPLEFDDLLRVRKVIRGSSIAQRRGNVTVH